jgi:ribosome-associated protein
MLDESKLLKELRFSSTTSGGPGGQHANRSQTAAICEWDLGASQALSPRQKTLLQKKLASRLNQKGILQIRSEQHRSLKRNKEACFKTLVQQIRKALKKPRKRKKTTVPRSALERARKKSKRRSEIKKLRKKPEYN